MIMYELAYQFQEPLEHLSLWHMQLLTLYHWENMYLLFFHANLTQEHLGFTWEMHLNRLYANEAHLI